MKIARVGSQPSGQGPAEYVYRPDIEQKSETLYKKPGYRM